MSVLTSVPTQCVAGKTARAIAALRSFSNLPYSGEIAVACDAHGVLASIAATNPRGFFGLAPLIEQRSVAIMELLMRSGIRNVIELGSGFSPLGLKISERPEYTFVEADLPEVLFAKSSAVLGMLSARGISRRNVQFLDIDAASRHDFARIYDCFGEGPVAILTDGLLDHLTDDRRKAIASNVRRLLRGRGGVWITPDLSLGECLRELSLIDSNIVSAIRAISDHAGLAISQDAFLREEDGAKFFGGLGFTVARHVQSELAPRLDSLLTLEIDPRIVKTVQLRGCIWSLTMKDRSGR